MTDKKITTTWAEAAKLIRKDLKAAFPTVKFTVVSRVYSGGSSVDIDWIDGPTSDQVRLIVGVYQYGNFDGMTDCYDYTNVRRDLPQVKYVQVSRQISTDMKAQIFDWLKRTHAHFDTVESIDESSNVLMEHWSVWTPLEYIWKVSSRLDLTNGFNEKKAE